MTPASVACIWLAVGALAGVAESLSVARGHGYYFNTISSLLSFLFVPAAAYAVAGVLVGAILTLLLGAFTRSLRRALALSTSLCLPFFIILFWGAALDGRFFGTVGNALGHIGMVAAAVAALIFVRRLLARPRGLSARFVATASVALLVVCGAIALAALPHGSPAGAQGRQASGPPSPNVLLVTIDTLRADRTGYSGYISTWNPGGDGLGTTPALDALASAGAVYTNAIVPEVVTDPSHASLLTGVPPWEHGVIRNAMPLPTDVPVLAEAFAAAGYSTAAFVAVEHLDGHISHLSRGFQKYSDCGWEDRFRHHVGGKFLGRHVRSLFRHERDARDVCAEASAWLEAHVGHPERPPFFVWVHVFDPHMPYVNHETGRVFSLEERAAYAERARVIGEDMGTGVDTATGASGEEISTAMTATAAYDSEIRFADDGLGSLLDALTRSGVTGETIICVTSDHGEHMNETHVPVDQWFAHVDVFDEVCRVPLVLAGPGVARGVTERQVSSMDVGATLLSLARIGGGLGEGRPLPDPRGEFGSVRPRVTLANPHRELDHRSVRDGEWKLMERGGLPFALYDLAADPGETMNIIHSTPEVVGRLGAVLSETPVPEGFSMTREAESELDPALREMLEALGYIQ